MEQKTQENEKKFIIYLHIPKAAGMTVQRMIRRRYGSNLFQRSVNLIKGSKNLKFKDAVLSKTMKDRFFMGHFCYGIHHFLPHPYTYITFLREPISRLLSLYKYSRSNEGSYYHGLARNVSPEDFFFKSNLMELDNGMLRFIVGKNPDLNDMFLNRTRLGECNQEMLNTAKQHIDKEFSFVGIVEKFDESVVLLKKVLGWKNAYYLKRNTSSQHHTYQSNHFKFTDELVEKLQEKNQLDLELYQFAKERFERYVNSLGDNFTKEVTEFQKNNANYNRMVLPLYNKYDSLKTLVKG